MKIAQRQRKTTRPQKMNQQLRTRKDLLQAASRLLKSGRGLTMDEIAKEALVSRATAYRYFSDINDLMTEVVIDQSVPDPKEVFRDTSLSNVFERVDHAESVMHDFVYENEQQLRLMLSRSLTKQTKNGSETLMPARQNRRAEYIEEALAPYRREFTNKSLKTLSEALALVFGPEAMIVFQDVIQIDSTRAREVKRWILTSLIETALNESRAVKRRGQRS